MEIKQKLIPASDKTHRPGYKLDPQYLTIHETDNPKKGAGSSAHARLQYNGNSREASWHYQVDDKEIWQSIPDNEVGWACGDGRDGTGNRKSISIEICVNADGNFDKAKQNAIWLIRHLMDKHNIPITKVVPHQRWSGKNCPRHILPVWSGFINQIKAGSAGTVSNGTRVLKLTAPYMTGDDVKRIQEKLGVEVDGVYGPLTMNKVTKFQKANGLATDGIVGPATLAKLLAPPVTPEELDMYDTLYLKDYKLIGLISSKQPSVIKTKIEWAMNARANCTLLLKRGFDLRDLQKALNEMFPLE